MTQHATDSRQRYQQAIRYFIYGQVGFFVALLICILLLPQGVTANHGVTYYSEFPLTVTLYTLAVLAIGVCTFLSSSLLPTAMPFSVIRFAFRLMVPLLFVIGLTTPSISGEIGVLHMRLAGTMFVLQLALDGWLALIVYRDRLNLALLLLLLIGSSISLVGVRDIIPYLTEGQIVFQMAFGLLMIHSLRGLRGRVRANICHQGFTLRAAPLASDCHPDKSG